jgi:OOP family OmpA-OmpF porin
MLRLLSVIAPLFAVLLALAGCQSVPAGPGLSAPQIAVLQSNGFIQVGDDWQLGLPDRLLFPTDQSGLAANQVDRLRGLARTLSGVGISGARVDGNTDSTGAATYNRQLSLRRANAVKQTLVEGGMDAAHLRTFGLGESNPIESNATAPGRQENRRVVIIVSAGDVARASGQ